MSVFPIEVKTNPNIPAISPGDTVRVHVKVVEGDRVRTQVFQGVVIKMRQGGISSRFTVRRVAYGVGVERSFPLHSPLLEKVEVTRKGKVRRARLYYLRGLSSKAARIKEKRGLAEAIAPEAALVESEAEAAIAEEVAAETAAKPEEAQTKIDRPAGEVPTEGKAEASQGTSQKQE